MRIGQAQVVSAQPMHDLGSRARFSPTERELIPWLEPRDE